MIQLSHGYFTPVQLRSLTQVLDNVIGDQEVTVEDRERLAEVVIALAQRGVASNADLGRELFKMVSSMMLSSGNFLKPRVRKVTPEQFAALRARNTPVNEMDYKPREAEENPSR